MTQTEARKLKRNDLIALKETHETLCVIRSWQSIGCVWILAINSMDQTVSVTNRQVKA